MTYFGIQSIFPGLLVLVSLLGVLGKSATLPLVTNLSKAAMCRERGDHLGEANLLALVGVLHAFLGDHALAMDCCRDAVSMALASA